MFSRSFIVEPNTNLFLSNGRRTNLKNKKINPHLMNNRSNRTFLTIDVSLSFQLHFNHHDQIEYQHQRERFFYRYLEKTFVLSYILKNKRTHTRD